jgi:hypothetical protein
MRLSKTSFVAGAIFALVLGSGSAYAATGGKFILGRSNSAGATSTLSSSHGPALSLKASGAALKVSNGSKITNLNADTVDGLDSTTFARTSGKFGEIDATGTALDVDSNGKIDTIVANATCPSGTQRSGGGAVDGTTSGLVFVDAPDTDNSWTVAVSVDEATTEDPASVTAAVVCYNPTGAVAGAQTATQMSSLSPQTRTQILTKAQYRAK